MAGVGGGDSVLLEKTPYAFTTSLLIIIIFLPSIHSLIIVLQTHAHPPACSYSALLSKQTERSGSSSSCEAAFAFTISTADLSIGTHYKRFGEGRFDRNKWATVSQGTLSQDWCPISLLWLPCHTKKRKKKNSIPYVSHLRLDADRKMNEWINEKSHFYFVTFLSVYEFSTKIWITTHYIYHFGTETCFFLQKN